MDLPVVDSWFQNFWEGVLAAWPYSDWSLFLTGWCLAHTATFWILNGILFVFYYFNAFPSYRIHGTDFPPRDLVINCLVKLFINHFVVQPVILYFAYPFWIEKGWHADIQSPVPPVTTMVWQIFFFIAVEDTLFYWAHRTLHHRSIYKYIHKKHHAFKATIGIAAEYAHPLEEIFANIIPTFSGPWIVGAHPFVLFVWIFLRIIETVDAHCGYRFPFPLSVFQIVPWLQGGAPRHDFHHSHNVGSYGSWTKFWDWAMGTDVPFKKFEAERLKKKSK